MDLLSKFKMILETSTGLGLEKLDPGLGEDKAVPLITLKEKKFVIEPEAMTLLRSINRPVAVLCVCGKYRTGKSYLLNKVLLGHSEGFSVGPTINPCTKGLWLWKRPLKIIQNNEEISLLIIDTEGLGAMDEDENHDTQIALLGMLLSSMILYNSMGSIDENALNSLSLVVNIAKSLGLRSAYGADSEEDEFAKNFPSFLWVLRDFSLQLLDTKGNSITSKQYLENALSLQKGSSEIVETKNEIRRLLKHFFSERDCVTLVRPTEDERDLQRLITLPEEKLRKEFISQLVGLKSTIKRSLKAKLVNGKRINGAMLADLCQSYTETLNAGKIPSIESTWNYACKSQFETGLREVESFFTESIKERLISHLPLTKVEQKNVMQEIIAQCTKRFKEKLLSDISSEEEEILKKLLSKFKFEAKRQISLKSQDIVEIHFNKLTEEIEGKLSQYSSLISYKKDLLNYFSHLPSEIQSNPNFAQIKLDY